MKEGYFRSSHHATWIDKIILNKFHSHTAREGQLIFRKCLERLRLNQASWRKPPVQDLKVKEIEQVKNRSYSRRW